MLSSLTGKKTMGIIKMSFKSIRFCTSGSVVEYRLAKARVAGSNPVSCSQRDRKKSHPMDGSFFYVQALPGSNGSNVSALLRSSQSNVPRTFCDVSCSQ